MREGGVFPERERERGIEEVEKVMEGEKETTVWSEPKRERERERKEIKEVNREEVKNKGVREAEDGRR